MPARGGGWLQREAPRAQCSRGRLLERLACSTPADAPPGIFPADAIKEGSAKRRAKHIAAGLGAAAEAAGAGGSAERRERLPRCEQGFLQHAGFFIQPKDIAEAMSEAKGTGVPSLGASGGSALPGKGKGARALAAAARRGLAL